MEVINLWDHQKKIIARAVGRTHYAIFAEMGVGKTCTSIQILRSWCVQNGRPLRTLVLCPPAVRNVWKREIERFSKLGKYALVLDGSGKKREKDFAERAFNDELPDNSAPAIFITNYESLLMKGLFQLFKTWGIEVLIIDECFAEGTLVDTPTGRHPIEKLKSGDEVFNALGVSKIKNVFKRHVIGEVQVSFNGEAVKCSLNHLWLTSKGWVPAKYLKKGDKLVKSFKAMQLVRDDLHSGSIRCKEETFLRTLLQREMEDETARDTSHDIYRGSSKKDVPSFNGEEKSGCFSKNDLNKPNAQKRNQGESKQDVKRNALGSNKKSWEWSRTNPLRANTFRRVTKFFLLELRYFFRKKKRRLPNELQGGYCSSRDESSYRSGRVLPLFSQGAGHKKRQDADFFGVESVKILEQGYSTEQTGNYFHDLEVSGHPSFSVNGVLVHNSQRVKDAKSKRTKLCIELADITPYKLLLTGTPILNTAMDIWSQFRILDKGETFDRNFYAFRARYFYDRNANMPTSKHFPDWRPLPGLAETFNKLIYAKATRVLKKDCLDLPPLVRQRVEVDLSPEQERMYIAMRDEYVAYMGTKACVASIALTKILRLQQMVSGFWVDDEEDKPRSFKDNPRLIVLKELLRDVAHTSKVIVWASFRHSYIDLIKVCEELEIAHVCLYGGMTDKSRQVSIDSFQTDNKVRVMIANPAAGGVGITLTAASYMIYYSRTFSLEHDLQSEARAHRGGSEIHDKITRIDIVTPGTVDEVILDALERKENLASDILRIKDLL